MFGLTTFSEAPFSTLSGSPDVVVVLTGLSLCLASLWMLTRVRYR